MRRIEYYEGDVFQRENRIRRVLGVLPDAKGNRCVVYSTGGNKNRRCRITAFRKFERAGKLIHAGAKRPPDEA